MVICVTDALEEQKCIGLKQSTLLELILEGFKVCLLRCHYFVKKYQLVEGKQVYRHAFEILAVCHAYDCHTHGMSSSNVKVDLPFRGVTIIRF